MLCGSFIFAEEAAEDGPTLYPLLGEVSGRMIGPGWAELAAAMGPPPVVVGRVLVQGGPQMPWPKTSIRSVTSVRAVSTNRSA